VTLLHDNFQSRIAKVVKNTLLALLGLTTRRVFTRLCSFRLSRSMQHGLTDFKTYDEIQKWFDEWIALKDEHFFYSEVTYYQKSEKKL